MTASLEKMRKLELDAQNDSFLKEYESLSKALQSIKAQNNSKKNLVFLAGQVMQTVWQQHKVNYDNTQLIEVLNQTKNLLDSGNTLGQKELDHYNDLIESISYGQENTFKMVASDVIGVVGIVAGFTLMFLSCGFISPIFAFAVVPLMLYAAKISDFLEQSGQEKGVKKAMREFLNCTKSANTKSNTNRCQSSSPPSYQQVVFQPDIFLPPPSYEQATVDSSNITAPPSI